MKRTLCNKCNPKGIDIFGTESHCSECGQNMAINFEEEYTEEYAEDKCKSIFRFIKIIAITWLVIFSILYFINYIFK
jgi:uncharacterized membrane protein YvbJ